MGTQVRQCMESSLTAKQLKKKRAKKARKRAAQDQEKGAEGVKKQKVEPDGEQEAADPSGGFVPTVSVALPGSVIANAVTKELQTYLAGQLARAVAIFRADEVVVYADTPRHEVCDIVELQSLWSGHLSLNRERRIMGALSLT